MTQEHMGDPNDPSTWALVPNEGEVEIKESSEESELSLETSEQESVKLDALAENIIADSREQDELQEIASASDQIEIKKIEEELGVTHLENKEVKAKNIADYEKENNVDQDILARSYLVHATAYVNLSRKRTQVIAAYNSLEEALNRDVPGDDHSADPSLIQIKKEWDDLSREMEDRYKIMSPMVEHLTEETKNKYRRDFIIRGAVSPETPEEKAEWNTFKG